MPKYLSKYIGCGCCGKSASHELYTELGVHLKYLCVVCHEKWLLDTPNIPNALPVFTKE